MFTASPEEPQIFHHAKQGDFQLVVSEPILAEYVQVLGYAHIQKRYPIAQETISRIIADIRIGATLIVPTQRLDIVSNDPKDNKFFECAVVGNAQYIVSDDAHILDIGEYQGIIVLPSDAFLSFFGDY